MWCSNNFGAWSPANSTTQSIPVNILTVWQKDPLLLHLNSISISHRGVEGLISQAQALKLWKKQVSDMELRVFFCQIAGCKVKKDSHAQHSTTVFSKQQFNDHKWIYWGQLTLTTSTSDPCFHPNVQYSSVLSGNIESSDNQCHTVFVGPTNAAPQDFQFEITWCKSVIRQ